MTARPRRLRVLSERADRARRAAQERRSDSVIERFYPESMRRRDPGNLAIDGPAPWSDAWGAIHGVPETARWAIVGDRLLPAAFGVVEEGRDGVGQDEDLVLQAPDRNASVVSVDEHGSQVGRGVADDRVELGAQLAGVDHGDSPPVGSAAGATAPVVGADGADGTPDGSSVADTSPSPTSVGGTCLHCGEATGRYALLCPGCAEHANRCAACAERIEQFRAEAFGGRS